MSKAHFQGTGVGLWTSLRSARRQRRTPDSRCAVGAVGAAVFRPSLRRVVSAGLRTRVGPTLVGSRAWSGGDLCCWCFADPLRRHHQAQGSVDVPLGTPKCLPAFLLGLLVLPPTRESGRAKPREESQDVLSELQLFQNPTVLSAILFYYLRF